MLLVNQCRITQRVEFSAVPYQCSSRAANATVFLDLQYLNRNGDVCNCCVPATCTCNCNLLSACPGDKHYACQASYLDIYSTNQWRCSLETWRTPGPPISLICSLLDPTASVDEGEAARTVFVWTKNGSGFQLQPQHTPAWLSASERRVPLLRRLRRNSSCGSAADVCGDTAAAR